MRPIWNSGGNKIKNISLILVINTLLTIYYGTLSEVHYTLSIPEQFVAHNKIYYGKTMFANDDKTNHNIHMRHSTKWFRTNNKKRKTGYFNIDCDKIKRPNTLLYYVLHTNIFLLGILFLIRF